MSHQNHEHAKLGLSKKEKESLLTEFIQLTLFEEAKRRYQDYTKHPRIVGGNIVYD